MDGHANFAYSSVLTAPSPALSGTTLTLPTGAGALFPTAPFNVVVWPAGTQPLSTNAEIVRCTVKTGDVLTITRAQEGTAARTIAAGDQICAAITKKTITDIEAKWDGSGNPIFGTAPYNIGSLLTIGSSLGRPLLTGAGSVIIFGSAVSMGSDLTVGRLNIGETGFAGVIAANGNPGVGGKATLVNGTIVVNAEITATSIILLTAQNDGANTGHLWVSSRTIDIFNGSHFTIKSSNALDGRIVGYFVFEP